MAPSTTPQRLSLGGERKPSPLRTSALKSEKPLASPSVSVMEFDGENGEVITRKPRPSGQEARLRVRSGGVGRTLSNGNTAMQSPDVAGLEQLKQTMQATLGPLAALKTVLWLILPFWASRCLGHDVRLPR